MKKIIVLKVIALISSLYGILMFYVWHQQEKLLFKPDPFSRLSQILRALKASRNQSRNIVEWTFKTPDARHIQGFISYPNEPSTSTVIYFGGIREECSWVLQHAHHFSKSTFICLNYRGYGLSQGTPSEQSILQDTLGAIYFLNSQHSIDLSNLFYIGRSLGSGVAGFISNHLPPKAVCLVTPYDSVMAVAKRKYWFLPVSKLFRHPFNATHWACQNSSPMLMILSQIDLTVPHDHSERLFSFWAGPKKTTTLPNCDHSSVVHHPKFFPEISAFFNEFNH